MERDLVNTAGKLYPLEEGVVSAAIGICQDFREKGALLAKMMKFDLQSCSRTAAGRVEDMGG